MEKAEAEAMKMEESAEKKKISRRKS